MKKRLLTIALLAVLTLSACGGSSTSESESVDESETTTEVSESEVNYSVSITNKDAFADWHVGNDDIKLSLTLDPNANITTEMNNGNLVVTSSNTDAVYISGLNAQAVAEGTATITVSYYGATDSVDVTVLAKEGISRSNALSISALRSAITAGTVVSGDTVITYGRITAAMYPDTTGDLYAGVYLTDGEAGIMLYSGSLSTVWDSVGLSFGDDIIVTGEYSPYNGLSEIKITDAEILSETDSVSVSDTVIWEPTAAEWAAAGDEMTGRIATLDLVYQSGTFDSTSSHQTLTFAFANNTATTVTVYCNYHIGTTAMTELQTLVNGLSAGTPVTITSVVSYYSGLQLGPVYTYYNGSVVTPASLWTVGAQVPTQNVTVSLASDEIEVGKTTQATATVDAGAYGNVTWTSDTESVATVDANGVVTGVAAGTATITATAVDSYGVDENNNPLYASGSATITVVTADGPYAVSEFVDGGTYVLGVYQENLGYDVFFAGSMSGNYGVTTTEYESATAITVNSVEGGYTLSFVDSDNATQYLYFNVSGSKVYFGYTTDATAAVLTYNSEYNTFTQNCTTSSTTTDTETGEETTTYSSADYYFGNYNKFDTISASNISYAASSFVSHLYDYKVGEKVADTLTDGGTYVLGVYQANLDDTYYFAGSMSGNYGVTTTNPTAAAVVTLNVVTDGYTLSFVDAAGATQYLYFNVSGSKVYFGYTTDANVAVLTYNETYNTFTQNCTTTSTSTDSDGNTTTTSSSADYYFGNYNNFSTISASTISYAASSFVSHLYEVPTYPAVKGLTLSASAESCYVGSTVTVSASYYPTCIESDTLTWASSDSTIATVVDGVVTGVAAGTVTITATASSGASASIALTIEAVPTGYASETFVAADQGYDQDENYTSNKGLPVSSIEGTSYTLALNQGTHSSSSPSYFTNGSAIRCYGTTSGSNNLVFTPVSGYELLSIEITCVNSTYTGGAYTYDNATVSASDAVLTIVPTDGTSAVTFTVGTVETCQLRIVSYTVTYQTVSA